jgi:hypothetical protein
LFATGVVDTGGNLPPVRLTPLANLPLVSTTLVKLLAKFATGDVDTIGKFSAAVVDTGDNCRRYWWCTLTCKYLREFSKKFEMVLLGYSGAGGKQIHEKNQKQKIS